MSFVENEVEEYVVLIIGRLRNKFYPRNPRLYLFKIGKSYARYIIPDSRCHYASEKKREVQSQDTEDDLLVTSVSFGLLVKTRMHGVRD